MKEYDIWMYFAWKCTTLIKKRFSLFFVHNVVFLMKPICIQVMIKHEHIKIWKVFVLLKTEAWFFNLIYNMFIYS